MSDRPPTFTSRPRAGIDLPGIQRPRHPDAGPTPSAPHPISPPPQPARETAPDPGRQAAGLPPPERLTFGGSRRVAVGMRAYPELWAAYAKLASQMSHQGRGRVCLGDLVNAVLVTSFPSTPDEAQDRLTEYRRHLEADPPADLRAV